MGASGSKASATAAKAATGSSARRLYPSRAPGATPTSHGAQPSPSGPTPVAKGHERPSAATSEGSVGPRVHPPPSASGTRTNAIDLDARDPDFASRLSQIGPVRNPSPTFSPSSFAHHNASSTADSQHADASSSLPSGPSSHSIFPTPGKNPAIAILNARQRIEDAVEAEKIAAGRRGFEGRTYADVATLRKALVLRDEQGMTEAEIEGRLGLKVGTVRSLGGVGTVEAV